MCDFALLPHGDIAIVVPQSAPSELWLEEHVPAGCPHWQDGVALSLAFVKLLLDELVAASFWVEVH